ncbi:4-hydroxythreonine-4-phosphate dehydrogenase PdxA [Methyloceanibacter sp. wino2]|uniref:4-hydroxythreonine-4-phosphate dehydrogenase PdxA n=1 Tax=Methyloceanibacter sp. wino2 TaxID=2170729 RepID=UPI000D3E55BD|nr:4-hydroxythreonine-4-phosphate dehydrogenase PdxA [Methyloceanibacter sp. wino2]
MSVSVPKPLALTIGDPAGIGPDITLLAFEARHREQLPPFVYLGDKAILEARAKQLGLSVRVETVSRPMEAVDVFADALPILPIPVPVPVQPGTPEPGSQAAVTASIEAAVEMVQSGEARAVVTNPISKSNLYQAGFTFPGHTEYLAALASANGQAPHPVMMLASDILKVVPVTIHIPLKDVPSALTRDLLMKTIAITDRDMRRRFGLARPRIAVSGLNPHAGEDGSLGREETDIIASTILAAQDAGLDVHGPYPADTLFHEAARERYDVAICMYHDQALVPFKTLAFEDGVNVTLGLPFVRTSPDHGTAFDIAGTGKANPRSLIEALRLADAMTAEGTGSRA